MTANVRSWYDYALQQMVAETYFEGIDVTNADSVRDALRQGNNRLGFETKGLTRFTDVQAAEFVSRFQIIAQASDYADPQRAGPLYYTGTTILANSGMSATLIQ